ncbi:MAG: two-component regulator propeller domain-containing protein [Rhodospirillales bacterium]
MAWPAGRVGAGLVALLLVAGAAVSAPAAVAQQAKPFKPTMENFRVGKNVYVRSLAIDKGRNSLWVGTSVGALEIDLATQEMANVFTRQHGLANEYVFAIGVAPSGAVWFGTNAGGTSTYKDGAWKTYFPMHGLADYWVYSFAFQGDDVWIGTWNGVNKFEPATQTFTTFREELVNIWVYGIDIDAQGRIWFGTEGGVSMLDGERWTSWTHDDGLGASNLRALPESPNTGLGTRKRHDLSVFVGTRESYNPNYVFATKTDSLGRGVWFGTWGGGVSLFDGGETWTTYTDADGLAGNIVYSIAQEPGGILWFGTNHGVSRFDGKTWTNFRHGLLGPHVFAIAVQDDGVVWLGTKGGVTRLVPVK